MGLFKKNKDKKEVLQQDLSGEQGNNLKTVFLIRLLMEEKCELPSREEIEAVFKKHSLDVHTFTSDGKMFGCAVMNYSFEFKDVEGPAHPQLMVTDCFEIKEPFMSDIDKSQLWNCPDGIELLETCKYQLCASDILAAMLDYKDRANMIVDYVEALVELFPACKAVVFENSKKMQTREDILNCEVPKEARFIYYTVNVRFFNIEGTDDMLVDSLGMHTVFMPDLQYHFHGMDPNAVVNHAYSMLSYIFDNDNPIKDGDTIDGVRDGHLDMDLQWKVQYESALIQPVREVMDVNMGEYASGER